MDAPNPSVARSIQISDRELKERLESLGYEVPPLTNTVKEILFRKLNQLDEASRDSRRTVQELAVTIFYRLKKIPEDLDDNDEDEEEEDVSEEEDYWTEEEEEEETEDEEEEEIEE